jgi:RNA polymerase sigma-70 factor (ECF subfamily)
MMLSGGGVEAGARFGPPEVEASDDGLVRRARQGDRAAFDELLAVRLDRCFRFAWSILANEADAADATQDALVAAWRELPRLRDPAAFDSWLGRIVATAARLARRRRRAEWIAERAHRTVDGASPAALAAIERVESAFDRAFARLGATDRALLVVHHVDGRPVAEIAHALRIPVGTAKWRLHAARRSLARHLEAEG